LSEPEPELSQGRLLVSQDPDHLPFLSAQENHHPRTRAGLDDQQRGKVAAAEQDRKGNPFVTLDFMAIDCRCVLRIFLFPFVFYYFAGG
jgi:hypothetical protein